MPEARRPRSPSKLRRSCDPEELVSVGPMIPASWSVPKASERLLMATKQPVPPPIDGMILLDLGASTTCISLDIADELKLVQTRMRTSQGAGGIYRSPIFKARLAIAIPGPADGPTPLVWEQETAGIPDIDKYVEGVDLRVDGLQVRHLGLLGCDIMRHAVVYYNGIVGRFQINFEVDLITRCP